MTLSTTTSSITILASTTFNIMTFSTMFYSITTLSRMTFGKAGKTCQEQNALAYFEHS
jgi:hypothetical protein